jgi:hypothetical protein
MVNVVRAEVDTVLRARSRMHTYGVMFWHSTAFFFVSRRTNSDACMHGRWWNLIAFMFSAPRSVLMVS